MCHSSMNSRVYELVSGQCAVHVSTDNYPSVKVLIEIVPSCLFLSLHLFFTCLCALFILCLSRCCPSLLPVHVFLLPCLCLAQTSRRSSHRCERSTIREQYHALECCYFWVSHALNPTPPCCLCCATVIVMHRPPHTHRHTATTRFPVLSCFLKHF